MAMTSINVRVDAEDKQWFDSFCNELGLTMSSTINMFIKNVRREKRIPFGLHADPYYTGANMRHIEKGMKDFAEGRHGRVFTMEELEARLNAAQS